MSAALPSGTYVFPNVVEEATARSLIVGLQHRYAMLARDSDKNHDWAPMAALFEFGSTIDFPDGRKLLPTQLGEVTVAGPPKLLRHWITTIDIQFASADEAHCQSYVMGQADIKVIDHWIVWDDVICRQPDGRWLFRSKKVTVSGVDPNGWLAKTQCGLPGSANGFRV